MYSYVSGDPIFPGDINFDEQVDVLDIVLLVNFVLDISSPSTIEFFCF